MSCLTVWSHVTSRRVHTMTTCLLPLGVRQFAFIITRCSTPKDNMPHVRYITGTLHVKFKQFFSNAVMNERREAVWSACVRSSDGARKGSFRTTSRVMRSPFEKNFPFFGPRHAPSWIRVCSKLKKFKQCCSKDTQCGRDVTTHHEKFVVKMRSIFGTSTRLWYKQVISSTY